MQPIKIALQKSGRLNEKSVDILKKSGLNFENYKSSLISSCSNFPLEFLFLRDDDIPEYVQDGIAHIGICGENILEEQNVNVTLLQKLGFGKCALKLAIPVQSPIKELSDLNGKSIATTYPHILQKYLTAKNLSCNIITISGSVEIAPNLGLSDAICDIVSTGGTLKSNGLKPFTDVMFSEAVLIGNNGIAENPIVQELLLRIRSVLRADGHKYIVMNILRDNLPKIVEVLPGLKSPTVIPLAEEGWVAVHTIIPESDFWDKISKLKELGAQGIAVMPMEKIIE